jgi:hypothetical protein
MLIKQCIQLLAVAYQKLKPINAGMVQVIYIIFYRFIKL